MKKMKIEIEGKDIAELCTELELIAKNFGLVVTSPQMPLPLEKKAPAPEPEVEMEAAPIEKKKPGPKAKVEPKVEPKSEPKVEAKSSSHGQSYTDKQVADALKAVNETHGIDKAREVLSKFGFERLSQAVAAKEKYAEFVEACNQALA